MSSAIPAELREIIDIGRSVPTLRAFVHCVPDFEIITTFANEALMLERRVRHLVPHTCSRAIDHKLLQGRPEKLMRSLIGLVRKPEELAAGNKARIGKAAMTEL